MLLKNAKVERLSKSSPSRLRRMYAQVRCKAPTLLRPLQTWSLTSLHSGRILDSENTRTMCFSTVSALRGHDSRSAAPAAISPACCGVLRGRCARVASPWALSFAGSPGWPIGRRRDRVGCTRSNSTAIASLPVRTATESACGRAPCPTKRLCRNLLALFFCNSPHRLPSHPISLL
jgi:hypothetical protein